LVQLQEVLNLLGDLRGDRPGSHPIAGRALESYARHDRYVAPVVEELLKAAVSWRSSTGTGSGLNDAGFTASRWAGFAENFQFDRAADAASPSLIVRGCGTGDARRRKRRDPAGCEGGGGP
jgi:hypothetical protein